MSKINTFKIIVFFIFQTKNIIFPFLTLFRIFSHYLFQETPFIFKIKIFILALFIFHQNSRSRLAAFKLRPKINLRIFFETFVIIFLQNTQSIICYVPK